ncbi:MAG: recombinase family protein [Oscillospiraceae bacterium]|jgi:DNA invertase Pin-like site-specific DNA recombinase|nr:recombinase family protein [Oscillospiraceae bacterium]
MGETKYTAGIYLRLSKDDERIGESVSIENQRLLLTKYAEDRGIDIKNEYADDGWSGTNMNRPAFQRMLRDAEDHVINMIIVKDLSRVGRNYIEVGRLTEETLPRLGCRFVALNDSVDSTLGENDMMVYRNLFNEFYSKDTSKKVRAVKQACMRQGKFLGAYAPIGYKKDPLNKHRLLIDEETAPIVRRIFALRREGTGQRAISNLLNTEHIPSPRELYYSKAGKENPCNTNHLWSKDGVKAILSNEVYLGNLVQGKHGSVSYKNHSLVKKAEEQWVRVENTHEALVSRADWDIVRSLDGRNYKPRPDADGEVKMFTGLLRCADCGFKLRSHISRDKRKDGSINHRVAYICGNYAHSGKAACTVHMVQETALIQLVLDEIREHAAIAAFDEERVVKAILNSKNKESLSLNALHRQQLKMSVDRLAELDRIVRTLYEDRVNGVITETIFKDMMTGFERERAAKEKDVNELRTKVEQCERDVCDVGAWVSAIRKYSALEELTQAILIELIDYIEVFEPESVGKQRICNIRVHYRFVDCVSDALAEEKGGDLCEQVV